MHFSRAISLINTPSVIARRAQLARGRLAGKGWTPGMRRAVPLAVGMVLMLLIGAIHNLQFHALAGNLLFWAALGSVLIGGLGLMITGDRDARAAAQVELNSIWAEVDSRLRARLLAEAAFALLSSQHSQLSTPAITKQKSNISPPSAPGGRSLAHICLTPRLCSRPRAAAQRLPCE